LIDSLLSDLRCVELMKMIGFPRAAGCSMTGQTILHYRIVEKLGSGGLHAWLQT
jgi:hypothetical protein